jgi:hypothetical protein
MLDTPDIVLPRNADDYNELESIAEWVLEDLMDMENAMPEEDNPERDLKKEKSSNDWNIDAFSPALPSISAISSRFHFYSKNIYPQPFISIPVPPPNA